MSLLGIDVGTTGCKAVVFSETGRILASSYREYDFDSPEPGQGQMDSKKIWRRIKEAIRAAASSTEEAISALSVCSLGESTVPVSRDGEILAPSLLLFDPRGDELLADLRRRMDDRRLYRLNGNTLGSQYGLTKLLWVKENWPQVYEQAHKFLFWSGFVAFMLGAEEATDYTLANRSLLFDLDRRDWSEELLTWSGLDRDKLPRAVASGTEIGKVSSLAAKELGLPAGTSIVSGAHDQCANALGCGLTKAGKAMFGLGTYLCIVPVFEKRPDPEKMIRMGLNTEHHTSPELFVSFIYNQCGSAVKWYRDTFAAEEHVQANARGEDIYTRLFSELPEGPSGLTVLPHFSVMGPPGYISNSSAAITGLTLATPRGAVLKGILEGATYSLKACVDRLPEAGIPIEEYRAVGGGSKSLAWVQLCADILGRPFVRPDVTEAGALGAAILAGIGSNVFASLEEGARAMVRMGETVTPDPERAAAYEEQYEKYNRLRPLLDDFLRT